MLAEPGGSLPRVQGERDVTVDGNSAARATRWPAGAWMFMTAHAKHAHGSTRLALGAELHPRQPASPGADDVAQIRTRRPGERAERASRAAAARQGRCSRRTRYCVGDGVDPRDQPARPRRRGMRGSGATDGTSAGTAAAAAARGRLTLRPSLPAGRRRGPPRLAGRASCTGLAPAGRVATGRVISPSSDTTPAKRREASATTHDLRSRRHVNERQALRTASTTQGRHRKAAR